MTNRVIPRRDTTLGFTIFAVGVLLAFTGIWLTLGYGAVLVVLGVIAAAAGLLLL